MNEQIRDAFDAVHADEALKQKTKAFIHFELDRRRKQVLPRVLAVACAAAVILLGGSFSYFYPIHALSVDVNPSVELGINCYDRVVKVRGWNEDGIRLEQVADVKYRNYRDAVHALVESDAMEPYLSQEDLVTVTVLGSSRKKSEEMVQKLSELRPGDQKRLTCRSADPRHLEEAHEAGLSFGKYQSYLELQKLAPEVSPEDVRDLPMCRIRQWIRELSGETVSPENGSCQPGTGDQGCGQGGPGEGPRDHGGCQDPETSGQSPRPDRGNHGGCRKNSESHGGCHGKGGRRGRR